jgi:ribosomal protein L18
MLSADDKRKNKEQRRLKRIKRKLKTISEITRKINEKNVTCQITIDDIGAQVTLYDSYGVVLDKTELEFLEDINLEKLDLSNVKNTCV